jgi:hypothetical protein
MTVTGGLGTTTWTVTRGVNSTTAASHVISQAVNQDDAGTSGELSWNAATKTLTVSGTIYIDGSATISDGAINTYNGQATLYLSGTFYANGSLCAAVSGTTCNFAGWQPDKELLMIIAAGSGGQVNPGDGIQIASRTTSRIRGVSTPSTRSSSGTTSTSMGRSSAARSFLATT